MGTKWSLTNNAWVIVTCRQGLAGIVLVNDFVREKSYKNWDWTILCAKNHTRVGIGRFCARKIIQELVFNNFVQEKSYKNWYLTILSRKNHTKFCI